MKIKQILNSTAPTLSFEVFPPKKDVDYRIVEAATEEIGRLAPSFMSVTYGAGGGTSRYTIDIANHLKNNCQVTPLAHLTCVTSDKQEILEQLKKLDDAGIENILALRGDKTEDMKFPCENGFSYAAELVRYIKENGDFCVGGACYPEGHVEASSKEEDILHLKEKVDAGCDFLVTQMFFDNNILYNYLYRIREHGITVPMIAGIMPVTNGNQIKRICQLSGTYLPARFKAIVEKFGDNGEAMKQAGIAYATEQIIDLLANGVKHIHVYSMNKPEIAARIKDNLKNII